MSNVLMGCAAVVSVWTWWTFRKRKGLWLGGLLVVLVVWTVYCFGWPHSYGKP